MLQHVTKSAELVKFLAIANDPERISESGAFVRTNAFPRKLLQLCPSGSSKAPFCICGAMERPL
ncbi:hypothetical protein LMG28727_06131 [Paraburkholderia kirstenboschensis]|uniref:hypothetical protein n=1 Tax=Paraburkholderia kirstenboschensis TaxID=1245436 RepID=UPI000AA2DC59|nr:hypothetical protein [Paraburkholderia kirstenboschensis]CAD6556532.1 hypothetical protein LMG28727_06131 [Paraburkholderia kirstenboschensis]